MIIDANHLENNHLHKTPICIIGSGAAGITLAMRLAIKHNVPVTLLESSRVDEFPDECAQQLYSGTIEGVESKSYLNERFLYRTRKRAFGGSTNCWGGWVRPMNPYNFTKRPGVNNPEGWPITYDDLLPYYQKVQQLLKLGEFSYDDPEYWAKKIPTLKVLPITPGSDMKVVNWQVVPNNMKRFETAFKSELTSAKITIIRNANVLEIETNEYATSAKSLRVGVIASDSAIPNCSANKRKEFKVQANQYIVACGGRESIRLLLLSKKLGNSSGLLGRYFFTHPTNRSAAYFTFPNTHPIPSPILKSFENNYIPGTEYSHGTGPQVFAALEPTAQYLSKTNSAYWRIRLSYNNSSCNVNLNFAQIPHYDSRIELGTELDYFNQPKVNLNYVLNTEDKKTINHGINLTRSLLSKMNYVKEWKTLIDIDTSNNDNWSPNMGWAQHHMGATRMSSDPKKGVLDKNMKLHDVDNVYVCSSSAWASGDISNPTMTILAFAYRLADHIFFTNYANQQIV